MRRIKCSDPAAQGFTVDAELVGDPGDCAAALPGRSRGSNTIWMINRPVIVLEAWPNSSTRPHLSAVIFGNSICRSEGSGSGGARFVGCPGQ